MNVAEITNALDEEILKLQQVRQLLQGPHELTPGLRHLVNHKAGHVRRTMSVEGRRRIAEAQKRRWAKAKGL